MLPKLMLIRSAFLKIFACTIVISGLIISPLEGQTDTVKSFKNTIRFNISNPVLFDWKFNIIGYERVVRDYQTISLSLGRAAFPTFAYLTDSLGLRDQYNDRGYHFSFDYRFYLHKENRHDAPRGVYVGPYYAYNYFSRDMVWDLSTTGFDGEAKMGMDLSANLFGLQMGYQFIFWDRFSLDLVLMGPGLWHFNLKSNFATDLSYEDEELLLETLNEMLREKFPYTDFVIKGGKFEAKKTTSTDVMGFRYMVNIGFRF